jgi:hypothetical protein
MVVIYILLDEVGFPHISRGHLCIRISFVIPFLCVFNVVCIHTNCHQEWLNYSHTNDLVLLSTVYPLSSKLQDNIRKVPWLIVQCAHSTADQRQSETVEKSYVSMLAKSCYPT